MSGFKGWLVWVGDLKCQMRNSFLKAQAQAEWDAIKSTKKVLLGQLIKQYIEKVCQHKVCWYCKRKICFVNGFIQYIFKFMMHHNFDQIHDTPKTWQDIIHLRLKFSKPFQVKQELSQRHSCWAFNELSNWDKSAEEEEDSCTPVKSLIFSGNYQKFDSKRISF